MKSNRGVTITGLVIYVGSFLMICGVIAVITTFFYNNSKYLSSQATASSEFDILNAYLAKEAKTEGNEVIEVTSDGTTIKFSNGNKYIFNSGGKYGQIYFCNTLNNKYFLLCNYIDTCNFTKGDKLFSLEIEILRKKYTQTYNLSD